MGLRLETIGIALIGCVLVWAELEPTKLYLFPGSYELPWQAYVQILLFLSLLRKAGRLKHVKEEIRAIARAETLGSSTRYTPNTGTDGRGAKSDKPTSGAGSTSSPRELLGRGRTEYVARREPDNRHR